MLAHSVIIHLLLCFTSWTCGATAANPLKEDAVRDFFGRNGTNTGSGSAHTNNWAVLVCASRYWFNYRVCNIISC